jgi:hypothetical protein
MSSFSGGELELLLDAYWNHQVIPCPNDGAEIFAQLHSHLTGYLLILGCPRCGVKAQVTHFSDPKRSVFRKWTRPERESLAMNHECAIGVRCPVCNAQVKCRAPCQQLHLFECHRCGNQHETMSFKNEQMAHDLRF